MRIARKSVNIFVAQRAGSGSGSGSSSGSGSAKTSSKTSKTALATTAGRVTPSKV